jgi:hypothetical protein
MVVLINSIAVKILCCLMLKHFIIDCTMQGLSDFQNKFYTKFYEQYLYSILCGLGTFTAFAICGCSNLLTFGLGMLDAGFVYAVFYCRNAIISKYRWSETRPDQMAKDRLIITSSKFFIVLRLEQMLHYTFYLFIVYVFFILV